MYNLYGMRILPAFFRDRMLRKGGGHEQEKKASVLLIAALALMGAGACVMQGFMRKKGMVAYVQWNTETIAELDLDEDTELLIGEGKDYNRIRVEDGAVFCAEADCADQICVHTGKIDQTGEIIACLPHKLVIYVAEPQ